MASREKPIRSFPKYLILGPSNVLRGNTGSLPNIKKNGESSGINKKGNACEAGHEMKLMLREAVCSEESLTLEIFGDTRTTNTRHR